MNTRSVDSKRGVRTVSVVWVNYTGKAQSTLSAFVDSEFDVHGVCGSSKISAAIDVCAPLLVCFEFELPTPQGLAALAKLRDARPNLPILMIIGAASHAVVLWALRIRVWDLLVKPVAYGEFIQRINSLAELAQRHGLSSSRDALHPSQVNAVIPLRGGAPQRTRTQPAIDHVMTHFASNITLADAASLCRLSPSRFSHVFRQEQGVSFRQHLLQYRLARASEQLVDPAVQAKKVAYSVGFSDLSYFARAFKRRLGVCPSRYHAIARLS